jgi:hypothetical protein
MISDCEQQTQTLCNEARQEVTLLVSADVGPTEQRSRKVQSILSATYTSGVSNYSLCTWDVRGMQFVRSYGNKKELTIKFTIRERTFKLLYFHRRVTIFK